MVGHILRQMVGADLVETGGSGDAERVKVRLKVAADLQTESHTTAELRMHIPIREKKTYATVRRSLWVRHSLHTTYCKLNSILRTLQSTSQSMNSP